jgi:hypothetical protein
MQTGRPRGLDVLGRTILRIHGLLAGAALGAALLLTVPAFAAGFTAELDPASHDNSTRAQVQGEGAVTGTLAGNRLVLNGHFTGLSAAAARARLGQAMVLGTPAASFFADLTISRGNAGSISGSITLTPAQLASLNDKALFIQIDSTDPSPNGTLWGWFLPDAARRTR